MTFTPEQLRAFARWPHLLGHLVGKTKLTKLHSEWIRLVWLAPFHSQLQAHRNAYKTTAIDEIGIVWWLLFHPNRRVALLRETHSTACDTLRTIGQYFENELIQEVFRDLHGRYPRAIIDRADRLVFDFKSTITKEGSIDAYGGETIPTGSHYDDILGDDLITIKDRYSRAKREKTKLVLQEIITNILEPGQFFRHIGTPWHIDDAWTLPGLPEPWKYDVYTTGILTPEQIQAKRDTTTPVLFAINYELKHIANDDAIFKDPNPFDDWTAKRLCKIFAHVDARFKGDHSTALTIMALRHDGRYQVWGTLYDKHVKDCVADILKECGQRHVAALYIEDNPDKGWAADMLARPRPGLPPLHVLSYHETMNKQKKIEGFISDFWTRLVFSNDCDDQYLEEIFEYRGAEPDDAPDSLASLIREAYYDTDPLTSTSSGLYQE